MSDEKTAGPKTLRIPEAVELLEANGFIRESALLRNVYDNMVSTRQQAIASMPTLGRRQ